MMPVFHIVPVDLTNTANIISTMFTTYAEGADSGDSRLQKEEQLFAEESLLGKYLVLGGEEVELR